MKNSTMESQSPNRFNSSMQPKKNHKLPTFDITNEEIDSYIDEVKNRTLITSMETSLLDLRKSSLNSVMDQSRDERMLNNFDRY